MNPTITIRLLKPGKQKVISYEAVVLKRETTYALVHARWDRPEIDLGYMRFSPGDHFYEHFYSEHWYNIYEIRTVDGSLKGWYCNITRPAVIEETLIISEDLEIDLFVSPDRKTILVLDEDEFEARGLSESDPIAYQQALAAVDTLSNLAKQGAEPFGTSGEE